jgi:chromosomal replication initiation ATPase DnaA
MSEAIKVVVRVRPMNNKEITAGCQSAVQITESDNQIILVKPGEVDNTKSFTFDTVFREESQQSLVYEKTAFRLVESVLEGYNGTIFAYGQTGCGKTHSMVGKLDDQHLHGLIPRSFTHVLKVAGEMH